jgi:hypothetical protein
VCGVLYCKHFKECTENNFIVRVHVEREKINKKKIGENYCIKFFVWRFYLGHVYLVKYRKFHICIIGSKSAHINELSLASFVLVLYTLSGCYSKFRSIHNEKKTRLTTYYSEYYGHICQRKLAMKCKTKMTFVYFYFF